MIELYRLFCRSVFSTQQPFEPDLAGEPRSLKAPSSYFYEKQCLFLECPLRTSVPPKKELHWGQHASLHAEMAEQHTCSRASPNNCCFLTRVYARELCVLRNTRMQGSRTHSKKQPFLFLPFEKHLGGTVFSISQKMSEASN